MDFNEWLCKVKGRGLLCGAYSDKIDNALSKKYIVDLALDANGCSYICEIDSKGYPLPYEVILKFFASYINGRYVSEHKNDKGNGYTSCLYCCYSDSNTIEIGTTLTTLLGCSTDIYIKDNDFCKIYADKNCNLRVHCPATSRCIVEYWKGANVVVLENYDKIELIEHE